MTWIWLKATGLIQPIRGREITECPLLWDTRVVSNEHTWSLTEITLWSSPLVKNTQPNIHAFTHVAVWWGIPEHCIFHGFWYFEAPFTHDCRRNLHDSNLRFQMAAKHETRLRYHPNRSKNAQNWDMRLFVWFWRIIIPARIAAWLGCH